MSIIGLLDKRYVQRNISFFCPFILAFIIYLLYIIIVEDCMKKTSIIFIIVDLFFLLILFIPYLPLNNFHQMLINNTLLNNKYEYWL